MQDPGNPAAAPAVCFFDMNEQPTTDQDLLQTYLAGHDERCPACHYNLRGTAGPNCPECGRALALGVREAGGLARRRGLLLVIFGWLLVAGAIHGSRVGDAIHRSVTQAPQVLTFPTLQNRLSANTAWTVTLNPASGTSRITVSTSGSSISASQLTYVMTPTTAAPGGLRWSNVTWSQWVEAAWWTTAALVGAAGLAIVLIYRRRSASPSLTAALMITATLGAAGYCAAVIMGFVADLI